MSAACGSDFTAKTWIPSTTAASRAFASGTTTLRSRFFLAPQALAESAPRTGRTPPSSDSSPRKRHTSPEFFSRKNVPWQPITPSAIEQVERGAFLANVGGGQINGHRHVGTENRNHNFAAPT